MLRKLGKVIVPSLELCHSTMMPTRELTSILDGMSNLLDFDNTVNNPFMFMVRATIR
jgi:hypothetical protein